MKITIAEGGIKGGTWNHRVIRHDHPFEPWLELHEVYYDEQGNVECWTKTGKSVTGETVDELREDLERMARALDKPVLTEVKRGKKSVLVEMKPGAPPATGHVMTEEDLADQAAITRMIEESL